MSFQAMTWATEQRLPAKEKLVLLMLANCHNHHTNRCDPSHNKLAEECGLSLSSVKRAISELEKKKLLIIKNRKIGDVNLPNSYSFNFGVVGSQRTEVDSDRPEGSVHSELQTRNINQEYKHNTLVDDENIDQPIDDFVEETEPNPNQSKKTKKQNTPYQKIVELYEQILPELPVVNILNDTRKSHIRARWNEHPNHQDLAFWRDFFEYVRTSDFLMGKIHPRDGGKPFRANIDWLLKPVNFAKVTEGNYV